MKYLLAPFAVYIDCLITPGVYILTNDDLIAGVFYSKSDIPPCLNYTEIPLRGLILSPGFIDIHVHGGNGYDVCDISISAINGISEYKLKEGVTAFCPSLVAIPFEKIRQAAGVMSAKPPGAKALGLFIEGPYISSEYRGAHPKKYIRAANLDEIKELLSIMNESYHGTASFGIAPELENALAVIEYLKEQGAVIRIGHSGAGADITKRAIESGADIAIHIFNAMAPLSHKRPSIVNACLTDDNIYAELICDLVHVDVSTCKVALRCKGTDKIILITDCMRAGGLSDGEYTLGETIVTVTDQIARTREGTLAGATLTMNKAIWNMAYECGAGLDCALKMATVNPAKALNIYDSIGSVEVNKKADLTAFDDDLNIKFTMIDGVIKLWER